MKWFIIFCIFFTLSIVGAIWKNNVSAAVGGEEGSLMPCSKTPNCFRTSIALPQQKKSPIAVISKLVSNQANTKIVSQSQNYLHAVAHSSFFHFKDDIEIVWNEKNKELWIRSKARVGYYDFDVNKKRVLGLKKEIKNHLISSH